jgi:predicted glycosyltransferase
MSRCVLIAVTHLLGSGHLVRAMHLARALSQAGFAVTLASGGMPYREVAGEPFAFAQLPPVKVEGVDFRTLLEEQGSPIESGRLAARRDRLTALAAELRPDVVVTEHFPFGRRQLADEFLGLIAAARAANPAVLVLASIRDVLVTPRPDRVAEAHRRLAEQFDGVLVHGDESFLPLQASWPVTENLRGRLHYTGYLEGARPAIATSPHPSRQPPTRPPQDDGSGGTGDILVSGGGSGAALPLFSLCLETARMMGPATSWRLLAGRGLGQDAFDRLGASAPAHVTVEWARPDFPSLLAACALSISQAGYNTVLDLVEAGRPAIVVPFDAGAETEQAIRAQAMARAGLAECLFLSGEEPLTPARLAARIDAWIGSKTPVVARIDRDGAERSVRIVAELLDGRRGGQA